MVLLVINTQNAGAEAAAESLDPDPQTPGDIKRQGLAWDFETSSTPPLRVTFCSKVTSPNPLKTVHQLRTRYSDICVFGDNSPSNHQSL